MSAADRDHLGMVKLLLEKGADINAKTEQGLTVLGIYAGMRLRPKKEIVELLEAHGATE